MASPAGQPRHPIDLDALSSYLQKHMSQVKLPIEINQFEYGQSNPTYYITDQTEARYVLRKKPPGQLMSSTAHAIEREFKILSSLPADFPSPKVYALCLDTSIIGTSFYLMEFIKGRIFQQVDLPEIKNHKERVAIYKSAISVLARLHSFKPTEIGLDSYGSQNDFYERQIKSLEKISGIQGATKNEKSGETVGDIIKKEDLLDWYKAQKPPHQITIVHGDYKLDNLKFLLVTLGLPSKRTRVISVLDWELSTLGHPYSDLGNLLQPWYAPSDLSVGYQPTLLLGFRDMPIDQMPIRITADELLKQYCKLTGKDYPLVNWECAVSFAFFRLAVIAQGIAARIAKGQASSARASEYGSKFQVIGRYAMDTIEIFEQSKSKVMS
ncbi:hypothetical protein PSTT_15306 [Puccinia striiformis]|uniref:Aminoglycoside phosphotransferase domain-containing protein n=1 Tax=Puccinia striiformis TaxID=27350 RepID=A0A2S4UIE5_9BASI|nr:hypothetical protein PSTT_15306 [Puccinia striiformis]